MGIKQAYHNMKAQVASLVMWAEQNLKGKSGTEKKQAVLDMLCERISLPGPLNWIKRPVLKIVVNGCIDKICDVLNIVTEHEGFDDVTVDPEVVAEASTLPKGVLMEAQNIVADTKQKTVDDRLLELCVQYGLKEAHPMPEEAAESIAGRSYFKRSEFTCKCGCGANKTKQELVDTLNVVREKLGVPTVVTSGTRCEKHNGKVGGVANSNHMTGEAADIQAKGVSADTMWHTVRALYEQGKLPHLAGLGRYDTFTHVDTAPKKEVLREWDERKKKS